MSILLFALPIAKLVSVSKLTPKGWQKISQGLSGAQPLVNTLTQCRTLKACEDSSHPSRGAGFSGSPDPGVRVKHAYPWLISRHRSAVQKAEPSAEKSSFATETN